MGAAPPRWAMPYAWSPAASTRARMCLLHVTRLSAVRWWRTRPSSSSRRSGVHTCAAAAPRGHARGRPGRARRGGSRGGGSAARPLHGWSSKLERGREEKKTKAKTGAAASGCAAHARGGSETWRAGRRARDAVGVLHPLRALDPRQGFLLQRRAPHSDPGGQGRQGHMQPCDTGAGFTCVLSLLPACFSALPSGTGSRTSCAG